MYKYKTIYGFCVDDFLFCFYAQVIVERLGASLLALMNQWTTQFIQKKLIAFSIQYSRGTALLKINYVYKYYKTTLRSFVAFQSIVSSRWQYDSYSCNLYEKSLSSFLFTSINIFCDNQQAKSSSLYIVHNNNIEHAVLYDSPAISFSNFVV